jgi:hypothetical protein
MGSRASLGEFTTEELVRTGLEELTEYLTANLSARKRVRLVDALPRINALCQSPDQHQNRKEGTKPNSRRPSRNRRRTRFSVSFWARGYGPPPYRLRNDKLSFRVVDPFRVYSSGAFLSRKISIIHDELSY